jgi:siroheme synthase
MGVRNLAKIANTLVHLGRDANTPAAVIERATFQSQKVVAGTLADIANKASEISAPATIVIGELASMNHNLAWFQPGIQENENNAQPQLLAI